MVTPQELIYTEMPNRAVKWRSVPLREVMYAGKRLLASFYNAESKYALDAVNRSSFDTIPLKEFISNAYYPGRFKRKYTTYPYGVPFLLPSQINDVYPKAEKYISRLTKCDINTLRLKHGDVLLTRSGTTGGVTLVSKTLENEVFSDDVIRVSINNNLPGYVYAFLRSDIGNALLQTNNYGSVISHIEPEHLDDIPIPNPPDEIKNKINNLILCSFDFRDKSNELLDEAIAMFEGELELPSMSELETERIGDTSGVNAYNIKLSELSNRLDASFHVPVVKAIIKHLCANAAEVTDIGDKRISKDVILPGRFKRAYVEKGQGRVFIGGKQLFELDPVNKKYLSVARHGEQIKKQLELDENMTLITCSGTIGKVALVPRHWRKWTANQHIIRIVPANADIAGYISVFLSSDFGRTLITRFTYGSVIDEIDDSHVSQIPFPLLKNARAQSEINRLALRANELRYEAYQLEQEALRVLNDEVIYCTT